jgi:hypothetical protein
MGTPAVSFSELETATKLATPAAAPVTTAATEPTAPAPPQFTEQDISTLRTFADAGITLTNYQQLLQANDLMQKLPGILKSNPRILTAEIAKADPQAYDTLLDAISDEWYEVKGKKLEQQTANGGASSTATSTDPRLESEVTTLKSQIANLIQERNAEKSERQQTALMEGYNSAVSGLLKKAPDTVTENTKDHIRLKTQELIFKDPAARNRVAQGIYLDVAKYFAEASALVTADTKASAEKEHARRAEVEARGGKEIVPAAENVNGATEQNPNEDPIWGNAGMMKDLQAAIKASR